MTMNIFVIYRISLIATVFALISLISGCATTPNSKTLTNEVTIQSEQPISETNKEKNKKSIVERPKIKLTEDILFKVLIILFSFHDSYVANQLGYDFYFDQCCNKFRYDYRSIELQLHKHHFGVLIHLRHQE